MDRVFDRTLNPAMRPKTPAERAKDHLDALDDRIRALRVVAGSVGHLFGEPLGLHLGRMFEDLDEHLGEAVHHLGEAEAEARTDQERIAERYRALRQQAISLSTWLKAAIAEADQRTVKPEWWAPACGVINAGAGEL